MGEILVTFSNVWRTENKRGEWEAIIGKLASTGPVRASRGPGSAGETPGGGDTPEEDEE